jgi:hypothetical protein
MKFYFGQFLIFLIRNVICDNLRTNDYAKTNYSILIALLSLSIGILLSALALVLITMFSK